MAPDALERLAATVIRFFRGRFPTGITAEDAYQDACLLILKWREAFPADNHLVRKVRGVMQDDYGRLWRRQYATDVLPLDTTEVFERPEDDSVSNDVRLALTVLSARHRTAMELHLEGKPQREIAQIMGVAQPYVSRLLREGREKLKELLEEDYGDS